MKKKIGIIISSILILLTIGFIFNNSRKPVPESNNDSGMVSSAIKNIVPEKNEKKSTEFFDLIVKHTRKAAHIIEFFLLGLELTVFALIISKKFKPQTLWNIISSALAIAVIDESIQILSERGPSIRDVLIDLSGAAIGLITVLLINFIISSLKGRKKYEKA